jgi:hypothetical protein
MASRWHPLAPLAGAKRMTRAAVTLALLVLLSSIASPTTAQEPHIATWYEDGPGLYAAVPSYRFGDPTYQLRVSRGDSSVVVTVRDFCGCPRGVDIDLSPAAFAALVPGEPTPLSLGVIEVTIGDVHRAEATLPASDTAP